MKIRVAKTSDRAAWDNYVLNHPDGLPYHQFAWKEAVWHSYGLNSQYLLAEQDGSICGVLPLICFKKPFGKRSLVSLPYCDAGGFLIYDKTVGEALLHEALNRNSNIGSACLELRSAQIPTIQIPQASPHKVRMTLDLPDNSQSLMMMFRPRLRNKIRKPIKYGLSTKIGGEELLDDFYSVWSQNMRVLGSPPHSYEWFKSILHSYANRARVGVVYTMADKPVAAGIILLHNKTICNPWISSLKEMQHLNANILMYWALLSFATEKGYETFDFGRSTIGGGTYEFKLRWGCKPEPIYWYQLSQNGYVFEHKNQSSFLRTTAERCWRCLPLNVCNCLGPTLRRYISL